MRLFTLVFITLLLILQVSASDNNSLGIKDWRSVFKDFSVTVDLPKTNNLPAFFLSITSRNLSTLNPDYFKTLDCKFYQLLSNTSNSEEFRWNWGTNPDYNYASLNIKAQQTAYKFLQLAQDSYSQLFFVIDNSKRGSIGTISLRSRQTKPTKEHPLHNYYLNAKSNGGTLCRLDCTLVPSYRNKGIAKHSTTQILKHLEGPLDKAKIWTYMIINEEHPATHEILKQSEASGFFKCHENTVPVSRFFPLENGDLVEFTKNCFYYVRSPNKQPKI